MLRAWWTTAVIALSAFAGFIGWTQAPAIEGWLLGHLLPGSHVASEAIGFTVATAGTIAILCLFVLGFLIPALEDAHLTTMSLIKLRRARTRNRPGALAPEEFRQIFEQSHMSAPAAEYAAALVCDGRVVGEFVYRARLTPSAFFSRLRLVEEPLHVDFFRYFPAVLWALGAIIYFLGTLKGLIVLENVPDPNGAGLPQLFAQMQGGLLSALVPIAVAPVIGLTLRGALALRTHQLTTLWERIGMLYPFAAGAYGAPGQRAVGDGTADASAMKESLDELRRELVASHDRLNKTLTQQAKETGSTIARDVSNAGAKLMAQLSEVSRSVTQEQNAQAKEILKRTVAVFLAELERNYGNQLKDAHEILESCAALAGDIRKEFAQMSSAFEKRAATQAKGLVADLRKALDAQNEIQSRHSGELVSQFEQAMQRLFQETNRQAADLSELVSRLLAGVQALNASPMAMSGTELAKMSTAFKELRESLTETQSTLAPNLERIAAGMRVGNGDPERFEGLIKELGAATAQARETVERLQEHSAGAGAAGVSAGMRAKVRPALPDDLGRELSQALRALREETESSAADLPKI